MNLILVLISIILTTLVLNLHFRGPKMKRVPKWVRTIFIKCLGRVFCFGSSLIRQTYDQLEECDALGVDRIDYENLFKKSKLPQTSSRELNSKKINKLFTKDKRSKPEQAIATKRIFDQLENLIIQLQCSFDPFRLKNRNMKSLLLKEVVRCQNELQVQNEKSKLNAINKISEEWKILAMIIDRIFFFIYLSCLVVISGLFYVSERFQ